MKKITILIVLMIVIASGASHPRNDSYRVCVIIKLWKLDRKN